MSGNRQTVIALGRIYQARCPLLGVIVESIMQLDLERLQLFSRFIIGRGVLQGELVGELNRALAVLRLNDVLVLKYSGCATGNYLESSYYLTIEVTGPGSQTIRLDLQERPRAHDAASLALIDEVGPLPVEEQRQLLERIRAVLASRLC